MKRLGYFRELNRANGDDFSFLAASSQFRQLMLNLRGFQSEKRKQRHIQTESFVGTTHQPGLLLKSVDVSMAHFKRVGHVQHQSLSWQNPELNSHVPSLDFLLPSLRVKVDLAHLAGDLKGLIYVRSAGSCAICQMIEEYIWWNRVD